jgi:hypothetical protein
VVFVTRTKNHRKYSGFGFPRCKKIVFTVLFVPRLAKKNAKTQRIWRFSVTTRLRQKMQG